MPHAWLAAGYDLKSETERAAAEFAEARRLSRDCAGPSVPTSYHQPVWPARMA